LGTPGKQPINHSKPTIWAIGYGNRLRQDDGIGFHVIDRLRHRFGSVSGIHLHSDHQLGPELATDICSATAVIFIDASLNPLPKGRTWRRIRPESCQTGITHSLSASALISLVMCLYPRCPPAWMVSVQGTDFEFGDGLSPQAMASAIRVADETGRIIDYWYRRS
jgi:hydrogenase maturation protease